jgi:hypothetical protein
MQFRPTPRFIQHVDCEVDWMESAVANLTSVGDVRELSNGPGRAGAKPWRMVGRQRADGRVTTMSRAGVASADCRKCVTSGAPPNL